MQQRTRRSSPRRPSLTRRLFSTKRSWLPISAPLGRFLRSHKRLLLATSLLLVVGGLVATLFSQGALSPVHASSVLNNEGLTFDNATAKGALETTGNSYSETAFEH